MNSSSSSQLPSPYVLGKFLYERDGLWQFRLEDQKGIDSFCSARGLSSLFMGKHVVLLWQLGWLLADLVKSPIPIDLPGLQLVISGEDGFVYADERTFSAKPGGWVGAATGLISPQDIELFFHPYRYFVLYRIQRLLHLRSSPIQMLYDHDLYPKLLAQDIEAFERMSSHEGFQNDVMEWNRTSAIAIFSEPCVHQKLFNVIRFPYHRGFDEQTRLIELHWKDVCNCSYKLGLDDLEKKRADLCVSAEMLDPNKDVHTLLRLTEGERRLTQVRGKLGGAMCILSMAETLRRIAERAFDIQLKEEDELGFGMLPHGVKERNYGSDRPLDAPLEVKNQFLRTLGLDYGTVARWYVEGDTEYGAIQHVLGSYHGIELVNLRGSVVAKSGKGLAFRDDLRTDLAAHRFSFISLDGDRSDYISAVKKAAQDDEICGAFFVSRPDFEFANFTLPELCSIVVAMTSQEELSGIEPALIENKIGKVASASEFLDALKKHFPDLVSIVKGKDWGGQLMQYAWSKPDFYSTPDQLMKRPIVSAVEMALRTTSADYLYTRRDMCVHPETGILTSRVQP